AIAEKLRRARHPVLLAVNKVESATDELAVHSFHALGFGEPLAVSASVGSRSGDLLDAVVAKLPTPVAGESEETLDVAIVGRPNAGKYSLANRLLGEDRLL